MKFIDKFYAKLINSYMSFINSNSIDFFRESLTIAQYIMLLYAIAAFVAMIFGIIIANFNTFYISLLISIICFFVSVGIYIFKIEYIKLNEVFDDFSK